MRLWNTVSVGVENIIGACNLHTYFSLGIAGWLVEAKSYIVKSRIVARRLLK